MIVGRKHQIVKVVLATHVSCGFASRLHCGKQYSNQDPNDREHYQQYYQRESTIEDRSLMKANLPILSAIFSVGVTTGTRETQGDFLDLAYRRLASRGWQPTAVAIKDRDTSQ